MCYTDHRCSTFGCFPFIVGGMRKTVIFQSIINLINLQWPPRGAFSCCLLATSALESRLFTQKWSLSGRREVPLREFYYIMFKIGGDASLGGGWLRKGLLSLLSCGEWVRVVIAFDILGQHYSAIGPPQLLLSIPDRSGRDQQSISNLICLLKWYFCLVYDILKLIANITGAGQVLVYGIHQVEGERVSVYNFNGKRKELWVPDSSCTEGSSMLSVEVW